MHLMISKKETSTDKVSQEALSLIQKYEAKRKALLLSVKFAKRYNSIDEILTKKYKLRNIEKIEAPHLEDKTEFITDGVRGNIQSAEGNILSYQEAEKFIEAALNRELP